MISKEEARLAGAILSQYCKEQHCCPDCCFYGNACDEASDYLCGKFTPLSEVEDKPVKIRRIDKLMNDEELLIKIITRGKCRRCIYCDDAYCRADCKDGMREWLLSEDDFESEE